MLLLQYGMSAAFAVVLRRQESPPVVVIKHYVLALKPNDVRDAVKIRRMLGDEKGTRFERRYHARCVNISAFVVNAAGVLARTNGNIRRIFPGRCPSAGRDVR